MLPLNGSSQRLTTNNINISFINSWTVDFYFKLDSSASDGNFIINSGYGLIQTTCILDLMMMRNHLLKLLQVGQEQLF